MRDRNGLVRRSRIHCGACPGLGRPADRAGAQGRADPADELSHRGIGARGRICRTRPGQRADGPAVCRQARVRRLSRLPEAVARGTGGATGLAARQARAQSRAAEPAAPVDRSVRRSGRRQSARHVPQPSRGDFRRSSSCCATGAAVFICLAAVLPTRLRATSPRTSASCGPTCGTFHQASASGATVCST